MTYYHGSSIGGIQILKPFVSNHGRPYVYLTDNEVLAAIYAHNALTRPNGFFTYCFGKDRRLYYDEYFENQLEELYAGQSGFVYACEGDLKPMEHSFWIYPSEKEVPVSRIQFIPDIYRQLLQYEQEGKLIVRRFQDQSDDWKAHRRRIVENSLKDADEEYRAFVYAHFPELAGDCKKP